MAKPRVLILRAPGTNCDVETAYAFELAGAESERLHVNQVLAEPRLLARFQILCLPGGFSYGDDVAAGRILGNQIRHHLAAPLEDFKAADKLILGICNGFQILIKSGILLRHDPAQIAPATLTWNDSGKFEARWVRLRTSSAKSVFFAGIEEMDLPIAHAEGKFVTRDLAVLTELERNGQLVLRYADSSKTAGGSDDKIAYPLNPNGSLANVAALCDESGRVCGLMPHPERHVDATQHPQWTRHATRTTAAGDGLRVFQNAVRYFT